MEEKKKTNPEAKEAKENPVPENEGKLTDKELEEASGGDIYRTHTTFKKHA